MTDFKKVTLYKIKPIENFEDFLTGEKYDSVEIEEGVEGRIKYVRAGGAEKNEDDVPWLKFLNSGFTNKKYEYQARNHFPRAVMAIRIPINGSVVFYAATFGQHGDTFLEKDQIVHDFGIKVGMNICDDIGLRRVQTTVHEAISKQTERQASAGATLGVFGINEDTEFLRTISGSVKEEYLPFVESFKGKDSISIKFPKDTNVSWSYLVDICRRFEERYHSTDYRSTQFRSYDNLRHESDPVIIQELDKLLCAAIEAGTLDKVHLAPPEFVEVDELAFAYVKGKEGEHPTTYDDIRIQDIVSVPRRHLKNLTAQRLRSWRIYVYNSEQGKVVPKWNAYKCIVAEVDLNARTFVLSNGEWREVSENLKTAVDQFIANEVVELDAPYLPADINIWSAKRGENREEVYNITAAQACAEMYLLDKSKITIAGYKGYEVCDLIHSQKHIVHVKRYSLGAASISHLFTQGKFYAHAFSTDLECRADICRWIDEDQGEANKGKDKEVFKGLIPERTRDVNDRDYTIVFCILHDKDAFALTDLPFMSRYELMLSQKFLTEDRKFNVGVALRKVQLGAPAEPEAEAA